MGRIKKLQRILVTGGAGFIGSHLVDQLLDQDNEMKTIDNFTNGHLDNSARACWL